VGLERGPLSLVSTTEELLERKISGSGLENRNYGHRDPPRRLRDTLCPQKLALTPSTSGSDPVGIVRSQIQATECVLNHATDVRITGQMHLASESFSCCHRQPAEDGRCGSD
jgi:hypothetical protein